LYPVSKSVSKTDFSNPASTSILLTGVDVRFSAEQAALRDSVVQVVDRFGPKAVPQLDDAERAAKLDAAVDAAGWRELRTADEGGRPWASGVEAAIVAEELARGVADVAFVGPTLAAELRRLCGSPTASAAARETVGLTSDLGAPGVDVAVDAAGAASALGLDGGDVVELSVGGPLPPVDLTRPCTAVTRGQVIGALAHDDTTRWTALGLALACADLVGTMRGAVELSRLYAQERRQYGVAVGSFQAVQHLLADAYVSMEGSRSVALHAAWAVDALRPADAIAAASTAKGYCSRAARAVCETAIQVHGGIGNTWDCLAHVFLRRALLSIDLLGGEGPSLTLVLAHRGVRDGLR
jgi:alkylation response protein AidB-like acyl-CoA dehydrogenase